MFLPPHPSHYFIGGLSGDLLWRLISAAIRSLDTYPGMAKRKENMQ